MFGMELKIYEQLLLLKDKYSLTGIKAEFEAEGSNYNDIVRLRRITSRAGVALFLKIGGVEALRDIKDSLELGVDGLIAPMVESSFGLKKFIDALESVYKKNKIHLSINIETRNSVEELDEILAMAKGKIDNVTIGRTDLSASFLDDAVKPDTEKILGLVKTIGQKSVASGLRCTMGGSISQKTIEKLKADPSIIQNIECIETRKVVLPKEVMINEETALKEAILFEEYYILSKKEFSDLLIESEMARLEKLSGRA